MRLTDIAQQWLKETLTAGDIAIDATLGNGYDALFLARQVGATGHLYGFDVQEQAIIESKKLLADEPCSSSFFLKGHEHMATTLPANCLGRVKGIMFNLGWLPNSDKSVITQSVTTIKALAQSICLLAPGGRLTVMVYPGHKGGDSEAEEVMHWLEQQCFEHKHMFSFDKVEVQGRPKAPILLKIEKRQ